MLRRAAAAFLATTYDFWKLILGVVRKLVRPESIVPTTGATAGHRTPRMSMEDAKPGYTVEFHGLKGAVHLNGTIGHLVKFNKKEQRWAVRCDDEDRKVVNAKPANLKRATQTDSGSRFQSSDPGLQGLLNQYAEKANDKDPAPPLPMVTSGNHGDAKALHEAVLDCYYKRRKGGAVVFYGTQYMIAVEFFGPLNGNRGAEVEMVYVDRDRKAQAIVRQRRCDSAKELGKNFLLGETVEYFEARDEVAFFSLLDRYQRRAKSKQGLIDMKSGLKLYEAMIL